MATLIKIGNSQGLRIPKAIIDQAQLENKELALKIIDDGLLIQPIRRPREGWKNQFDKALKSQESINVDQEWIDAPLVDEKDWEW